jgi:hypothetical protein
MRRALTAMAVLLLFGCESTPQLPIAPPYRADQPAPARPASAATAAPMADTCGARPLQSLIGHPRTEIPIPVRPERQRVICTTCPMTMDYAPERLNFLFDATTGLIKEVRCG